MLQLERLEARDCPSSANLAGGVLTATLDQKGVNALSFNPGANPGDVSVVIDGAAQSFSGVTSLVATGSNRGTNLIENNTSLPATLTGGKHADTLIGGNGPDALAGGKGKDVMYDLVGTNTFDARDGQRDRVFASATATVSLDARDRFVNFFAPGRGPNSGAVSLEGGVLYLAPGPGGTRTVLSGDGRLLVLTSDWAGTRTFRGVKQIAYFGGSGNDFYANLTGIDDVAYGAAGNDNLLGGLGSYSLMKGSSGDDVLVGRAKVSDLTGNGGTDLLFALRGVRNVFRVDAADATAGTGTVLGPGV